MFREAFIRTVAELKAAGARVVVLENAPTYDILVPRMLAVAVTKGRDISDLGMLAQEHRRRQQIVADFFRQERAAGRIATVDVASALCAEPRCQVGSGEASTSTRTTSLRWARDRSRD